ncbi:hypothetical protein EGW08_017522 [Elysia chlorotica]|uniref:Uncharacterized protein n=1 Tax=Elysia chlorotica TaxID=188477 RepID=A0A433SZH2_ELYCH|nr:hypothetical protein EGW08_017522 [Elysia chlorotica]
MVEMIKPEKPDDVRRARLKFRLSRLFDLACMLTRSSLPSPETLDAGALQIARARFSPDETFLAVLPKKGKQNKREGQARWTSESEDGKASRPQRAFSACFIRWRKAIITTVHRDHHIKPRADISTPCQDQVVKILVEPGGANYDADAECRHGEHGNHIGDQSERCLRLTQPMGDQENLMPSCCDCVIHHRPVYRKASNPEMVFGYTGWVNQRMSKSPRKPVKSESGFYPVTPDIPPAPPLLCPCCVFLNKLVFLVWGYTNIRGNDDKELAFSTRSSPSPGTTSNK